MHTLITNQNSYKTTIQQTEGSKVSGTLNEAPFEADIVRIRENVYSIIKDGRSYEAELVKYQKEEKKLVVKINNTVYTLDVKDQYDELLHSLGLDNMTAKKVNDIKAPMPGMVLNVLVNEGQEVKKGDPLIVLEAMKMENILKSPADGTVKKIAITKGVAVEKNQLLIQF